MIDSEDTRMDNNERFDLQRIGLLIIGDELLLGRREDKHVPRAREYFSAVNVDISWIWFAGDDMNLLVDLLRMIRSRGDDCFSFGGIGATPDDRTRQAMAEAFDTRIIRHPEAVALIEHQFGDGAYPNRILMAELPEGAMLIPNAHNNIPGFSCGRVHCLPGFPEMAWPMLDWVVKNRYRVGDNRRVELVSFIVNGAKESELVQLLTACQNRFPTASFSSLPRFSDGTSWQIELAVRGAAEDVAAGAKLLEEGVRRLGFQVDSKQNRMVKQEKTGSDPRF